MATFDDKVKAIMESGKSEEAAKKIAGSMIKKEKKAKLKKRIAKQLLGVEFGTLGPDGKVTNKGSIDLDKIDSDDPIAYSMGYSEGTQNTKINPKGVEISPGVYDDYAPEYKRGWSEGNLFFKKTLKKTKGKGKFSKVRKAGFSKKDYDEERKEYEKSVHKKPYKRDLKHSPPVRESNPRTPLKKEVPFGTKNDLGKESKDTTEKMRQMIRHNVKGKKIRPPKPTQKQRARIIKARLAKIRKADQQDINRVKRWDSRSFNKKKELSGTTEPVFKTTAAIKPLTTNLRNRLAKLRKANGGIAPNYNNPSKVRKKKTATKAAGLGALGEGKLNKYTGKPMKLKPRKRILDEFPSEKQIDEKQRKRREKTALRSAVNKGVNKVNPIKPTKTYKKPRQGPNPYAETTDEIMNNAEIGERKNDTYVGKTKKRIARIRKAGMGLKRKSRQEGEYDDLTTIEKAYINKESGLEGSSSHVFTDLDQSPKWRNIADKDKRKFTKTLDKTRGARVRKATEQIDPRVKKRKTVRPDSPVQKVSQMKDRIAEMKTARDHNHKIEFKSFEGSQYRRASLTKQEGKYAKYWLLNAKQTNGNGWGVSPVSIAKNINKFIGRPFVITAKQWIAESEYGDQFEHPYLPTNNIENIISHQEKFRVGSIVDIVEKDGDYHAVIEMNSKFANMMLPPFCSPAIFQNNPGEADGQISDWEALHLAGLMEDPAYGARIALLKGSCMGTAEACSIQFKGAKQIKTVCPKKMSKLRGRLGSLKKNNKLKQRIATLQRLAVEQQITLEGDVAPERVKGRPRTVAKTKEEVIKAFKEGKPMRTKTPLRWGERLQPTYRTDGKNFFLHGNKILSKHESGYQTHVKDWITESEFEQITLDTLRDFGVQVNSEGKIIPAEQFFTKDGLAMKIKTKGDLTKKDMVIPANEISDGRVLVNKYKPPTGIKPDIYPYTPENLRNFAAESRRRATSMQVNSEGKKVPVGTLKGDPTGSKRRSLSETATQPDDAKTVNKILGLPEEQGLEKTFGKKKYDKKKTKTTYNKGKYKGIEGSKTHHTLFKKKTGISRPNPVARFKHTRNVKATPKGSFASPFANNPENAIQLSKPEHKELHRLNPHSNFRNIFESKLRLKIARMRYAEQDWSDIQDKDFFKNPYKPRKMTPDMGNMEYMDDLHNKASWNAGQRAMERFEKELSHPFSRKYAYDVMDGHAFNSSLMMGNNYPNMEDIVEKGDKDNLFSLLEGHNKEALESANYKAEDTFGFGEEGPRPTNKGEELGRGISEIFDRFKDEDYAQIPDRKGDMLKTKQILSDYTNDVSGGIMKDFAKKSKGLGAKRK